MTQNQTLRMSLPLEQLPVFFPLLQQGVWVQAQTGCSIMSLLSNQFGVAQDYVVERITTLFLNGKAVDNPETSSVSDGATIALSSAMPGLVGATMRRGGHLAAMRGAITYQEQQHQESGTGKIKIKLFNMVMAELGAAFLSHGVLLAPKDLSGFLQEQADSFWQSIGPATLCGRSVETSDLKTQGVWTGLTGEVLLRVEFQV